MEHFMKKASDILHRYFETHGLEAGGTYSQFFSRWQEIAGPGLADHSQVVDIKNGTAIVYVDHPGWIQKLTFEKDRILRRLMAQYPQLEITNLLMRCVEPNQMGKPTIDLQRKDLQENMKIQREKGRKALEAKGKEIPPVQSELPIVEDPEIQSLMERLKKLGS